MAVDKRPYARCRKPFQIKGETLIKGCRNILLCLAKHELVNYLRSYPKKPLTQEEEALGLAGIFDCTGDRMPGQKHINLLCIKEGFQQKITIKLV